MKRHDNSPDASSGDRIGTQRPTGPGTVDPSADDQPEAEVSGQKRRGGAPVGNQNAGKHLAYSKLRVKRERRSRRRWIVDLRAKIADAYGLDDEPLLDLVGEPLADLDGLRRALAKRHERGIQNRKGEINASVKLAIDTCGAIIREARQVVDRIVEMHGMSARSEDEAKAKITAIAARWPGALTFRCVFDDGTDLFAPAPVEGDPLVGDPLASPAPVDLSRAAGEASPALQRKAPHPVDVYDAAQGAKRAPVAQPSRPLSDLERAWINGEDY